MECRQEGSLYCSCWCPSLACCDQPADSLTTDLESNARVHLLGVPPELIFLVLTCAQCYECLLSGMHVFQVCSAFCGGHGDVHCGPDIPCNKHLISYIASCRDLGRVYFVTGQHGRHSQHSGHIDLNYPTSTGAATSRSTGCIPIYTTVRKARAWQGVLLRLWGQHGSPRRARPQPCP